MLQHTVIEKEKKIPQNYPQNPKVGGDLDLAAQNERCYVKGCCFCKHCTQKHCQVVCRKRYLRKLTHTYFQIDLCKVDFSNPNILVSSLRKLQVS